MSPSKTGGDELSLRHLPDLSDTSFSFQIPVSAHEDNLLAEDDQEFFRGAYLSPVASVPPTTVKNSKGPLTLSQLTPRPKSEKQQVSQNEDLPSSFPTLSYHQQDADQLIPNMTLNQQSPSRVKAPEITTANGKARSKPRPKLITPSIPHLPSIEGFEGSPAGARLEAIKAEVDLLAKDELIQSSNVCQELDVRPTLYQRPKGFRKTSLEKIKPHFREEKRNRQGRTSQRVFEGGITKPKTTEKVVAHKPTVIPTTDSIFSLSERTSLSKDLNGEGESLDDTSVCTVSESEGVAARLVQYSQKLINPFGPLNSDGLVNSNVLTADPVQASETWEPASGTHTDCSQPEPVDDSDRPLTLSQLSPRKKNGNGSCSPTHPEAKALTPPVSVPMSPLRPSSKRPVSVDSEVHQWKKTKADASTAAVEAGQNRNELIMKPKPKRYASSRTYPKSDTAAATAVSGPSKPRPTTKSIASTSERGINNNKAKVKDLGKGSTITRTLFPAFKPESVPEDVNVNSVIDDDVDAPVRLVSTSKSTSNSTSTSRSASTSSHLRVSRQRTGDHTIVPVNSLSRKGKSRMSTSSGSAPGVSTSSRPAFHIPVIPLQQATRPVEFNLRTSSRSESRESRIKGQIQQPDVKELEDSRSQSQSSSCSQRERKHNYHDIPDFKALHAAQEAKLALLKENIHPTVPLPIKWETDERVKERQKFDEMIREKEREQERLKEEERRQREEEEEREVRELRKKAIPKAHEVPEWYKEAPKKKDKLGGSVGR